VLRNGLCQRVAGKLTVTTCDGLPEDSRGDIPAVQVDERVLGDRIGQSPELVSRVVLEREKVVFVQLGRVEAQAVLGERDR
jgi:hypothetical protein